MAYHNKSSQTNDLLTYYLTMNINNICRICLEKGPRLMPIFDPIKPPHFSILIMACASVQVSEGDGLPPYICQKCISKLNIAFQFKTQCESADAKLRQCFEHYNDLAASQDSYDGPKKEADSQFTPQDQSETALGTDHEHNETPVLETLQIVSLDAGTSLNELEKTTLTDLKLELTELRTEELEIKSDGLVIENVTTEKKSFKQHQCDTCGKTFRTKPGLVHHIRIHTGERPYVCHICDKRFINGGHLHTHMRTHTGEKNHVCAACNKAFATAQQLTKHTIAIHTSERPYACTYCPKRFASSSNLNTHTKIHTGEKNYRCEQCGKAFSTKGQLFQHMLVHTGEKAFLCEYCNKRFSQKAHLIRHLKTHNK